jgi:hypothetical protein
MDIPVKQIIKFINQIYSPTEISHEVKEMGGTTFRIGGNYTPTSHLHQKVKGGTTFRIGGNYTERLN